MISLEDVKIVIKNGHPEGWGRVLNLPTNKDCAGLGYNSQNLKKQVPKVVEGCVLPLSDFFESARHLVDGHICALEEEGFGITMEEGLVYKKIEGHELTNWTATEISEVTLLEK